MGTSCDWTRLRFTLDPGPAKAVRTTFVNLYNKGLIYRHERIINWCPRCATALSDLEVEYQEQDGKLYYIRYPLEDGSGHITVATTRPESMLGDTGVAVHPEDPRYAACVGKQAILPIMDRPIPIVGDEAIEQDFGTGALKVTPGHDVTDFEIGERHGLEIINVIGFDGNMTDLAGKYEGRERFDTRRAVAEELDGLGLLEKVEDYHHSVGHCQRCDSVVEPLISLQWFLKVGNHQEPDSIAGRAHRRRGQRRHHHRPRSLRAGLSQLAGEHPRLVHQPATVVGPSHTGLVLRRLRRACGLNGGSHGLHRLQLGAAAAGRGRAGHLVQLRSLASFHPGLAGRY